MKTFAMIGDLLTTLISAGLLKEYKYIFFIYLFIRHIPYPATAGSARNNAKKRDKKERTKKNGSGQKAKPSTSTQAIDAHMGEEEKNIKQKKKQKKETGSGLPT